MIKSLKWLTAVTACCLALASGPADGCQYNVREVGFIDLGIEPYRLAVYLPEGVSADGVPGLKDRMEIALAETNVRFEPVPTGADANHPALKIAKTQGISRFPAAVLVSPDSQAMPLALSEKTASLAEAVPAALTGILDSPARRQILEKCANTYGVVLLIEGPEPQANATARQAVSAAVQHIGENLEFLPKPIRKPPEMVVLDQKSLAREQVLLWTFRLTPEDVNRPHAAVFYGRGRWLGPLFEGEVLTADNLVQLLGIIGADCECGLDHRWLQGTMLPARWDAALQQKAVESLGFDPESPMIKMEIVSILRRGMGGFGSADMPLEYQEIEIGAAGADEPVMAEPVGVETQDATGGHTPEEAPQGVTTSGSGVQPPAHEPPVAKPRPALVSQVLAGSLAGMIAIVGLASMVIVLRARRR